MNIEQFEADILARLTASNAIPEGIELRTMPQTQAEYERQFEKGCITVAFNNARWRETSDTYMMDQTADVDFAIIIQSNFLRGEYGVYAIFNAVKKWLVGFSPTGCKKLKSKDFMLYSDEHDLFTFIYIMQCEFNAAQFIEDEDDPLITQITIDETIARKGTTQTTTNDAVIVIVPPVEEI